MEASFSETSVEGNSLLNGSSHAKCPGCRAGFLFKVRRIIHSLHDAFAHALQDAIAQPVQVIAVRGARLGQHNEGLGREGVVVQRLLPSRHFQRQRSIIQELRFYRNARPVDAPVV